MTRPRLLDLFCGAGGAAMGYYRAGFEVVGCDIAPQPNYPFTFHRYDALAATVEQGYRFDAIHASPPCQSFTAYRRKGYGVGDGYPNMIPDSRLLLADTGKLYVIENVEHAIVHLRDPVKLCGSSFWLDVRRHRLFESNASLPVIPCYHSWQTPRFAPASNRTNLRCTVEVGVWRIPMPVQCRAMGIDWMSRDELSQAVPPAYTEYVGRYLMRSLTESKSVTDR